MIISTSLAGPRLLYAHRTSFELQTQSRYSHPLVICCKRSCFDRIDWTPPLSRTAGEGLRMLPMHCRNGSSVR